jgi:hypothetical protein
MQTSGFLVTRNRLRTFLFGMTLASVANAQAPALEWTSMFRGIVPNTDSRQLFFYQCQGVFLPPETRIGGPSLVHEKDQAYMVLRRAGSDEVLAKWAQFVEEGKGVFSTVRAVKTGDNYQFEKAGDYTLTFQIDDARYTVFPFSVELIDGDDPFNPVKRMYLDGPWRDLAALRITKSGQSGGLVNFGYMMRGGRFNRSGKADKLRIEVLHEGVPVFVGNDHQIGNRESESNYREVISAISFPRAQGGGPIAKEDLLRKDGDYDFVLLRNDAPERVYRVVVKDGKVTPHPRQAIAYEPRADFLVPRDPGDSNHAEVDLFWLDALDPKVAMAAAAAKPAAVAGPSAADLARWAPVAEFPQREMKAVVTRCAPRADTLLAAGDDLIAYGTGPNTGVAFVRVGEDKETTFAGGSDCSSKVFAVCGKKLVLVRKTQVLVYDTEKNVMHEIATTDLCLSRVATSPYGAWPFAADGMLVATINDVKVVADRRVVKILDVSGDVPVVLALSNPVVPANELGGVGIDASTGTIVIGSQKQAVLYTAQAVADAPFRALDLSAHDGIASNCQPIVEGGSILYFDSASSPRFRRVDLGSGAIDTLGMLAKAHRCYSAAGAVVVHATNTGRGSNRDVAIFDATAPRTLAGSGGALGQGQSVVVAGNGQVFLAGMGEGGVGSGEILEVANGNAWTPIADATGAPMPAIDVVAGQHLVAFKTGKAQNVTVGYVLLGRR